MERQTSGGRCPPQLTAGVCLDSCRLDGPSVHRQPQGGEAALWKTSLPFRRMGRGICGLQRQRYRKSKRAEGDMRREEKLAALMGVAQVFTAAAGLLLFPTYNHTPISQQKKEQDMRSKITHNPDTVHTDIKKSRCLTDLGRSFWSSERNDKYSRCCGHRSDIQERNSLKQTEIAVCPQSGL